MRRADLKERSSVLFISRGLIIIAIVIASSASFLLGYLVGKSTTKENLEVVPKPGTADTKKEAKESKQTQESPKIIYTVQAGAFENSSEADTLKTKLDKQGYKAYVIPPGSKRDERLYKVRIGEFKTREEAELLSNKIKKTTGLQTFVTFKTEEEVR